MYVQWEGCRDDHSSSSSSMFQILCAVMFVPFSHESSPATLRSATQFAPRALHPLHTSHRDRRAETPRPIPLYPSYLGLDPPSKREEDVVYVLFARGLTLYYRVQSFQCS